MRAIYNEVGEIGWGAWRRPARAPFNVRERQAIEKSMNLEKLKDYIDFFCQG